MLTAEIEPLIQTGEIKVYLYPTWSPGDENPQSYTIKVTKGDKGYLRLTPRQLAVLFEKAVNGLTDEEAAERLLIEPATVKYHLDSIYKSNQAFFPCLTEMSLPPVATRAYALGLLEPNVYEFLTNLAQWKNTGKGCSTNSLKQAS